MGDAGAAPVTIILTHPPRLACGEREEHARVCAAAGDMQLTWVSLNKNTPQLQPNLDPEVGIRGSLRLYKPRAEVRRALLLPNASIQIALQPKPRYGWLALLCILRHEPLICAAFCNFGSPFLKIHSCSLTLSLCARIQNNYLGQFLPTYTLIAWPFSSFLNQCHELFTCARQKTINFLSTLFL